MRNKLCIGLLLLLSFASTTFADIPKPDKPKKPSKSIETSLSIRLDKDAHEAKLIIPREQVQQLRAQLDAADDSGVMTSGLTSTQTIVSGTLLSLALVFGGMWFVRDAGRSSKAVVTAAVLLACGSVATFVYGNAGPPPEARSITGKMFTPAVHMYKGGWGAIKLEVSDTATTPTLIVPDTPRPSDEE